MTNLLDHIGNTPLVELKRINTNPNVRLFGKLEGHNPGGSVKDRAAYGLIKGGIEKGLIQPDSKLIEATSGNTGIALAMIARLHDLHIEIVMPENSTIERVLTMRAFGAIVTLTRESEGMEGAIDWINSTTAIIHACITKQPVRKSTEIHNNQSPTLSQQWAQPEQ